MLKSIFRILQLQMVTVEQNFTVRHMLEKQGCLVDE